MFHLLVVLFLVLVGFFLLLLFFVLFFEYVKITVVEFWFDMRFTEGQLSLSFFISRKKFLYSYIPNHKWQFCEPSYLAGI